MKLEVGKFYRTRDGRKAEIRLIDKTIRRPVVFTIEDESEWYGCEENGRFHDIKRESDLISEWQETPEDICNRIGFDASCLPAWMDWIAMDRDGEWLAHNDEPKIEDGYWDNSEYDATLIPTKYEPKTFTGDWKESKFKVK